MAGYLCPMPLASSLQTVYLHPFLANRPLSATYGIFLLTAPI